MFLLKVKPGSYCQPRDGSRDYTNVSKCAMTNRGYFSAEILRRPGLKSKAASKCEMFKVFSRSLIPASPSSDLKGGLVAGDRGWCSDGPTESSLCPRGACRPLTPRPAPGGRDQAGLFCGPGLGVAEAPEGSVLGEPLYDPGQCPPPGAASPSVKWEGWAPCQLRSCRLPSSF